MQTLPLEPKENSEEDVQLSPWIHPPPPPPNIPFIHQIGHDFPRHQRLESGHRNEPSSETSSSAARRKLRGRDARRSYVAREWDDASSLSSFQLRETRPFLSPPPLFAAPPTRPLFSHIEIRQRFAEWRTIGGRGEFSAPEFHELLFSPGGCAFVAGISIHCKPSFTLFDPTSPWLEISQIERYRARDIATPSHRRRPVGGKQGRETGQNIWDRSLEGVGKSVLFEMLDTSRYLDRLIVFGENLLYNLQFKLSLKPFNRRIVFRFCSLYFYQMEAWNFKFHSAILEFNESNCYQLLYSF